MFHHADWRDQLWSEIDRPWDLIVIGGGITGAGILREAARAGLRTLLVEQNDFASGTSSWSTKLVHGGLRYLANGEWRLTRESLHERQALLDAAPGLVEPMDFLMPVYAGHRPGRLVTRLGLAVYDLMAGRWHAHYRGRDAVINELPYLATDGLRGAFVYPDARTDDARLVLRVIGEALADGGRALHYARVDALCRDGQGQVCGVSLHDRITDRRTDVMATAVINATGPWSDRLRRQLDGAPRLRPLRGSHLVFRRTDWPLERAVMLFHPDDGRPMFAVPWCGATLVGTTDLDHADFPDIPPRMTDAEGDYIMAAVDRYVPGLGLARDRAVSCFSGVRPVVGGRADNPGEASRDSAIWAEQGLVNVTGGKLTTYRVTAREVLTTLTDRLPALSELSADSAILSGGGDRLAGRYGPHAPGVRALKEPASVGHTPFTWAELRWALRHEGVEHLDDLLLRRTRLGLLLTSGGEAALPALETLCQAELGWDRPRWDREVAAYRETWQQYHAPARHD